LEAVLSSKVALTVQRVGDETAKDGGKQISRSLYLSYTGRHCQELYLRCTWQKIPARKVCYKIYYSSRVRMYGVRGQSSPPPAVRGAQPLRGGTFAERCWLPWRRSWAWTSRSRGFPTGGRCECCRCRGRTRQPGRSVTTDASGSACKTLSHSRKKSHGHVNYNEYSPLWKCERWERDHRC